MMPPEINKRIRQLLRAVLGITDENFIRPANQNAPTGTAPFATVLLMAYEATGNDDKRVTTGQAANTVDETQEGQRRVTASVQFFRGDALALAYRLPAALNTSNAIALMQSLGLGLVNVGPVRNIAGIVNTIWEERAGLDIEFHVIASETVNLPTFGEFPVSFGDGSFTQTFEVFEP